MSQEKVFQNPLTVLNYEECAQIVRNGKDTILLIRDSGKAKCNEHVCVPKWFDSAMWLLFFFHRSVREQRMSLPRISVQGVLHIFIHKFQILGNLPVATHRKLDGLPARGFAITWWLLKEATAHQAQLSLEAAWFVDPRTHGVPAFAFSPLVPHCVICCWKKQPVKVWGPKKKTKSMSSWAEQLSFSCWTRRDMWGCTSRTLRMQIFEAASNSRNRSRWRLFMRTIFLHSFVLCFQICLQRVRAEHKAAPPDRSESKFSKRRAMAQIDLEDEGSSWELDDTVNKSWHYFSTASFSACSVSGPNTASEASAMKPASPWVCFSYKDKAKSWRQPLVSSFCFWGCRLASLYLLKLRQDLHHTRWSTKPICCINKLRKIWPVIFGLGGVRKFCGNSGMPCNPGHKRVDLAMATNRS